MSETSEPQQKQAAQNLLSWVAGGGDRLEIGPLGVEWGKSRIPIVSWLVWAGLPQLHAVTSSFLSLSQVACTEPQSQARPYRKLHAIWSS